MNFVYFLIVGLAAGWLAGKVLLGRSFSLVQSLIVGVIGAFVGGFVFSLLQLGSTGLVGQLITAFAGSVLLLFGLRFLPR